MIPALAQRPRERGQRVHNSARMRITGTVHGMCAPGRLRRRSSWTRWAGPGRQCRTQPSEFGRATSCVPDRREIERTETRLPLCPWICAGLDSTEAPRTWPAASHAAHLITSESTSPIEAASTVSAPQSDLTCGCVRA
eukprot:6195727-Pleurochrysis_carterae.AAC.1